MLKCKVYVGGINNLSDARYCAGMMVDFLGFNIAKIGKQRFSEITHWVEGIDIVIEFTENESVKEINNYIAEYHVKYVALNEMKEGVNANIILLSDQHASGDYTFVAVDKDSDSTAKKQLVKGDVQPDELDALLAKPNVEGIYLQGGSEIQPGIKDFEGLADILEALEMN